MGKALALKWTDVDFHGRFIVISKAYRRLRVEKTKTEKTRRVDMSNQLWSILQKLYTKRQQEALAMGRGDKVIDLFFIAREG
jgi:integrase